MKEILTRSWQKYILAAFASLVVMLLLPKTAAAATLSISPSSGKVASGEELKVQVMLDLDKGKTIAGVDAILTYNSDKLKVKDVKSGGIFKNLVTKEKTGEIQLTALADFKGLTLTEPSNLASVTFEVLSSGDTSVGLEFSGQSTTDSNVTEKGTLKDLLTGVTVGDFNVQATPANEASSFLRKALPFVVVIFILILLSGGAFWFFKNFTFGGGESRADPNVFVPPEVPMDMAPEGEGASGVLGQDEEAISVENAATSTSPTDTDVSVPGISSPHEELSQQDENK